MDILYKWQAKCMQLHYNVCANHNCRSLDQRRVSVDHKHPVPYPYIHPSRRVTQIQEIHTYVTILCNLYRGKKPRVWTYLLKPCVICAVATVYLRTIDIKRMNHERLYKVKTLPSTPEVIKRAHIS